MFDCALLTPAITSATVGTLGSADILLGFCSSENRSLLHVGSAGHIISFFLLKIYLWFTLAARTSY